MIDEILENFSDPSERERLHQLLLAHPIDKDGLHFLLTGIKSGIFSPTIREAARLIAILQPGRSPLLDNCVAQETIQLQAAEAIGKAAQTTAMVDAWRSASNALTDRLLAQLATLHSCRKASVHGLLELFRVSLTLPKLDIDYQAAARAFAALVAEDRWGGAFLGLDLSPAKGRPHYYGYALWRGKDATRLRQMWCDLVGGHPDANLAQRVWGQGGSWEIGASPQLRRSIENTAGYAVKPLPGAMNTRGLLDGRLVASGTLSTVLEGLLDDFDTARGWAPPQPAMLLPQAGETCKWCSRPIPPGSRSDRRYCKDRPCRQAHYMRGKRDQTVAGLPKTAPSEPIPPVPPVSRFWDFFEPAKQAAEAYLQQLPGNASHLFLDLVQAEALEAPDTDLGLADEEPAEWCP